MFKNLSGKLQALAVFICFGGIIGSTIVSLMSIEKIGAIALLIAFLGCIASWLSSLPIYAIGEILEKTERIEKAICPKEETKDEVEKKLDEYEGELDKCEEKVDGYEEEVDAE